MTAGIEIEPSELWHPQDAVSSRPVWAAVSVNSLMGAADGWSWGCFHSSPLPSISPLSFNSTLVFSHSPSSSHLSYLVFPPSPPIIQAVALFVTLLLSLTPILFLPQLIFPITTLKGPRPSCCACVCTLYRAMISEIRSNGWLKISSLVVVPSQ